MKTAGLLLLIAATCGAVAAQEPVADPRIQEFSRKSEKARLKALKKPMDEGLLAHIAGHDESSEVRKVAVGLVKSQTLLARIAMTTAADDEDRWSSWDVRREAAGAVSEERLLVDIAQGASKYVRAVAAGKVTDQVVLARIALGDAYDGVRLAATQRLDDQMTLARIGQSDGSPKVRRAAVGRLTDETVLAGVAQGDASEGVRQAAASRVSTPALLAEIARADAARPAVRNVRWGMTKAEVRQAEGGTLDPGPRRPDDLMARDAEAFGFTKGVNIVYQFKGDALILVAFELPSSLGGLRPGALSMPGTPQTGADPVLLLEAVTFGRVGGELKDRYGEPHVEQGVQGVLAQHWRRGRLGGVAHTMTNRLGGVSHLVVFSATEDLQIEL